MRLRKHPAAVALVAVLLGVLLRLPLTSFVGEGRAPLQIFFLAVFLAAWVGGRSAGLMATGLSAVVSAVLFLPHPAGSLWPDAEGLLRVGIFVLIGVVFSVMTESRLRALDREARQREELQREQVQRAAAVAAAAADRDRLTLVTDHAPVLLAHCDRDRRFRFVNKPYADRLGLTPEQIIGHTIAEVLGPEVNGMLSPYVDRVLAGEPVEAEISIPYPQLGPQRVRCAYAPERNERGEVIGWIAALTNVTSQRRAEHEARKFAELVQNSTDFIGISDLAFRPEYVNAAGTRLVGLDGADAAVAGSLSVMDFFFPEDRARMEREFFPAVMRDGRAETEIRFRNFRTGEPRWMAYSVVLLTDEDGKPAQFATISRDIHEQKIAASELAESRERLRAALDASVTGTFRWNLRTNDLDWDDNMDRLFGLPPGTAARSLPDFLSRVHPDDRERVAAACRRCAETGADFEEEFRVTWSDGTERWIYDKARTYPGEDGKPLYMSGACLDITERRQKEDALRAADRQKDEFLGMLAHELRNPLAPIIYSAALLERQMPGEAARQSLDIISRQAKRMGRMVDDLLDASRVTLGKISLQREHLDFAAVVRSAAEIVRSAMETRGHRLEVHLPGGEVPIVGDTVRLTQVVENLLNNAAKYTPPGGRVVVDLEREGEMAVLTVADNGIGIEPGMLRHVFELFAQVDSSLDRSEGGLGIGLTLVDRLTALHGGSVEARSAGKGLGSTFVVRLPLAREAAAAASDSLVPVTAPPPRRYLVVEDNRDSAEALGLLLQFRGHVVRLVHDGREALPAARQFRPDVLVLDVGLPGMDGFEVVKQFRATPEFSRLLIIAATGYGRAEDRARCLAAGFDHHVTKPVDVDVIEALVGARQI